MDNVCNINNFILIKLCLCLSNKNFTPKSVLNSGFLFLESGLKLLFFNLALNTFDHTCKNKL